MIRPEQTRIGRLLSRAFAYEQMDGSQAATVAGAGRLQVQFPPICRSLHRWIVLHTERLKVYVHCWENHDWSTDFHDHSGAMWSIGLSGTYDELTPTGTTRYRAPWVRRFPATHQHRIEVVSGPVWTLVVLGRKSQNSAFWVKGKRVPIAKYLSSGLAARHKSCG